MLIVSRMDELPRDLPRTVHQALGLCVEAEADAQARKPWGTFTGMAMRFKQRFGEPDLGYQATVLASPPGTYNAAALLREIIRTREPQPVPGVHALRRSRTWVRRSHALHTRKSPGQLASAAACNAGTAAGALGPKR